MKKHEKYIERNDLRDATHLEVSVSYSKGGMSYFSGQTSPRGFYLSVTPVKKADGMVSFTMFSGLRRLLLEVNRYSDKQLTRAIELANDVEAELVSAVVEKNKAAQGVRVNYDEGISINRRVKPCRLAQIPAYGSRRL